MPKRSANFWAADGLLKWIRVLLPLPTVENVEKDANYSLAE